jgi:DNA-binding MarR family transcriptional regulator
LSALLETVRMEIQDRENKVEGLQVEISRLREVEAVAADLAGEKPAAPVRAAKASPVKRKKTVIEQARKAGQASAAARDGLGPSQQKVLSFVRGAGQPVGRKAIADELGMSSQAVGAAVAPLVKRGLVIAEGNTIHRTYRVPAAEPSVHRERTEAGKQAAKKREEVALTKVKVMDLLVREEPLTEVEITEQLRADRETVALACGYLLEDGHVELLAEGGYGVLQS